MYPLDKVTQEGRLFWSLPKRPPRCIDFDADNELHASFIASYACLYANMHRIPIVSEETQKQYFGSIEIKNSRSKEFKAKIAQRAAQFKVKDFVPSEEKAKEIED